MERAGPTQIFLFLIYIYIYIALIYLCIYVIPSVIYHIIFGGVGGKPAFRHLIGHEIESCF
jgi:hypothetical protein